MITLHTLSRNTLFLLLSLSFSILPAQLTFSPTANVTDEEYYPTLGGAQGITTVMIGENTYALVTAAADYGVQIIDITDPSNSKAVASVTDGETYPTLDNPTGIATVKIGDIPMPW